MKNLVEKLYFIPSIELKPNTFRTSYKPLINSPQVSSVYKDILESDIKEFFVDESIKVQDIFENYFYNPLHFVEKNQKISVILTFFIDFVCRKH